jgi:hypothetical protein
MEITITRTGGIAGLRQRLGPVDTAELPPQTAEQVSDIVATMDFFKLPTGMAKAGGADILDYETTIAAEGRCHTVNSNDNSPAEYKDGLARLVAAIESAGVTFGPDAPADV